jgi:(E)-4-hydroxy-3-methyl-but-2-enyl pyrophosphate reductase
MKQILYAKSAGFCYGVKRAVELAEQAASASIPYAMLGPIIHNDHVIQKLEQMGVSCVYQIEEIPDGTGAIIRSHGAGPQVYRDLEERQIPILDATCPNVAKIHQLAVAAEQANRQVILIGSPEHPEILAVAARCRAPLVFSDADSVADYLLNHPNLQKIPITILAQTTLTRQIWNSCIGKLKKECTNCEIFDTICNATYMRQTEAREIAARCDVMIVIGDHKSSNTRRLAELCRAVCPVVLHVEGAADLNPQLLDQAKTIGVTAGASTPAWVIKEVCKKMSEDKMEKVIGVAEEAVVDAPVEEGEESFAELLEQSIKTLYTGQKVSGVVTGITPTEIYVDLGAKQAGYIPIGELSDDPSVRVEDIVKVGDTIETYVMRVNDVEGVVALSKKRLDAAKNWEVLETARDEKTVVEGTVTEENKGGIVVSVRGIRVFVPASQTGLPRNASMSELVKQKVRLRITEVNRSRRGVMGSIRAVQYEERKAAAEKIWNEIEPGMRYSGVVKSLTSYGAFVDIGGVDGMVHISELSWSRVKDPSEVVSIGDQVEVYVIAADKEKKKISLGMKDQSENPWDKFVDTYDVGSIANVRIVKLMSFGAFAEIIPGVDGLIHISQIAPQRIEKPEDVLAEGQMVDVKIIAIDDEKHKVSLSIRAALAENAANDAEEE